MPSEPLDQILALERLAEAKPIADLCPRLAQTCAGRDGKNDGTLP